MSGVKKDNLCNLNQKLSILINSMNQGETAIAKYESTKKLEELITEITCEVKILNIEVDIKNKMANLYLDELYDYEEEKAIIVLKTLQCCKFLCEHFDGVDDYIATPSKCIDVFHSIEVVNLSERQVLIWFNTSSGGNYCFVCEAIEFVEY